jgi:NAD(P)-dependent dehydrogenase (short-subunit alcohol dehydrogenase family)
MDVNGISALVTGGGRGLGAALALRLAERGARAVVVARTAADVEAVARAGRESAGEVHALVGDLAAREDAWRIAGAAAALVGPIDLLVQNASSLGPTPLRLLLDTEDGELAAALEVNVLGAFRLARAVVGSMALRGRGLVVQVSSDAAASAYPRWGAYGASKAAADHLARVWAAELAERSVRFLVVDPGEMDTRMHAEAVPDADRAALLRPDDVAERLVQLIARAEQLPSGARVELARLAAPQQAALAEGA